jgi:pimeloyl-ACP methyl ester carboxylesterase
MGHSDGGPHALACGALLPGRVLTVVSAGAGALRRRGPGLVRGDVPSGVASLRAALAGRAEKEKHELSGVEYDPEFTRADFAALEGDWAWLGSVAGAAMREGPGGLIDDDLAYVSPRGCEPAQVLVPTLLLHGEADRVVPSSHSRWLAEHCPTAELRLSKTDGHISVLDGSEAELDWLRTVAQ